MVLSEVEETITTVELDEETFEEIYKVRAFSYQSVKCIFDNSSSSIPCVASPSDDTENCTDVVCER